jgi:16S rRNA processing protein RimM
MSSAESRPRELPQRAPIPPGDWVVVGTVVGPHGVRGEVKVRPAADRPGRLGELPSVTLALRGGRQVLARVSGYRPYEGKGVELLSFEGYADRTAAAALTGAHLLVRPEDSPALPEGEFYEWQLIGLRAVTTDGRDLGAVEEVLRTGANDVYVTSRGLLPATADVIKEIDLQARRIVVVPVPGLLDGSDE